MENEDKAKYSLKHFKKPNDKLYNLILLFIIYLIVFFCILISGVLTQYLYIKNEDEKTNEQIVNEENQDQIKQDQNLILKKEQEELNKKEKFIKSHLPVINDEGIERFKNIYFGDEKRVFLTFDDGPSENTTKILDILESNNINATFFVLGMNVQKNPELVKTVWEKGNYIASHGMYHNYKELYSNENNVYSEYLQSVKCIQDAIGNDQYDPHLFRFPGGKAGGVYAKVKQRASEILEENNVFNIDWCALNGDAEAQNVSEEKLIQRTIETVGDKHNIVLLMHDAQAKTTTVNSLQEIINFFKENGYSFKTFYDIFDTKDKIENSEN